MSLIGIVLFVVGAVLGLCWFSVIILPIFYGLPKSLCWIMRGKLKGRAVFACLVSPVIWTVIFVGASLLLAMFWPKARQYLYNSAGFFYGTWFGIIGSLIRSLTKSGRQDLKADFLSASARYQR